MTNRAATHLRFTCAVLLSAALVASPLVGQQSGDKRITRSTIAGGGGSSSNGATRVRGTIGQPATGSSQGGVYAVRGGVNSTPGAQATPTPTPTPTATPTPATATLQFNQTSYGIVEDCAFVTVTVTRTGSLADAIAVDYATFDGTASERSDYATALGSLRFDVGEAERAFDVLINEDSRVEGAESFTVALANPTGGAALGVLATTTIEITDDPAESATNTIDDTPSFVCQQYHDFLNRQPDPAGLAFWTGEITQCGADAQCREVKRVHVSAAFFLSIEFQETGYLVYRAYKAAYGDIPSKPTPVRLREFLADTRQARAGVVVGVGDWQLQLQNNQEAFAADFAARRRFTDAYPLEMSPAAFVERLNANAGGALSTAEREALINDLASGTRTRAEVLLAVARDQTLAQAEFNRAFVLMEYFGYLRRDPDDAPDANFDGYNFWLNKLNQFDGNFVEAEMVKAFISSTEYRQRFGEP